MQPLTRASDDQMLAEADGTHSAGSTRPLVVQYLNVIRRHWVVILGILFAALAIGLILTLLATPQFTSTTRIEISRQQANVTNVEGLEREEAAPSLEFYPTQYALLESQSLAVRVARRLRLGRDDAFFEAHDETPEGSGLFSVESGSAVDAEVLRARQEQAAEILLDHINISPVRGSALVNVSYTSANPELSARVANMWVREFIQQSMDRRFASTADARIFLEQRLDTLRRRLQESERELVNYATEQRIIRMAESASADGRTRTTSTLATADVTALNSALAEATAERVAAEGMVRAAQARGSGPAYQPNQALDTLRARRAELAADLARLLVRFEPEYPEARALREQLRTLDANIASEEGRQRREISRALDTAYAAAVEREARLRARVDGLIERLTNENRAGIQYNIFQREVDTNRELYDALLQRYKEIGIAGVGTNNIAVVDEALIPDIPSAPSLPLNMALALIAGCVVAGLIVFVLENIDEGIRDPTQLSDLLQLPLLGAIPRSSDEGAEALAQISDPKSQLAEAYMTVRTNLAFSTDHGVPRSLCVTSTSPAEGKSTTSFALAQVIGRTGKRVVLVDADLRRPRMAEMLELNGRRGVSNFLAGELELDSLIQATDKQNLHFVAAGPQPPSASELLSGERMQLLVNSLLERFDHVVIDCPPMLGLSDGPLIGRTVEGVVYVLEAESTSVRGARAAIARLLEARTRLIGVVLTKYRARRDGYGYGYGYGYGQDQDVSHDDDRTTAR